MLLLALSLALADPENTAAACKDGIDNDENGAMDCGDPGCAEFRFCDMTKEAPPPAPQPAFQVGTPPPQQRYVPQRSRRGLGGIISGSILVGVGGIIAAASIPSWIDALDLEADSSPGVSQNDLRQFIIAGTLTGIGTLMSIAGWIALGVGLGQYAKARRGYVEITPLLAPAPGGGYAGLSLKF